MRTRATPGRPPVWLLGLIFAVVLWLAVRIVGNVTESLTGMVEGTPPAGIVTAGRGL